MDSYPGETNKGFPIWEVLIGLILAITTIMGVMLITRQMPIKVVEPTIFTLSADGAQEWFKKTAGTTVSYKGLQVVGVVFDPANGRPNGVVTDQVYNLRVRWPAGILLKNDIAVQSLGDGLAIDKDHDGRCVTTQISSWVCTNIGLVWTSYGITIYPDATISFAGRPPS